MFIYRSAATHRRDWGIYSGITTTCDQSTGYGICSGLGWMETRLSHPGRCCNNFFIVPGTLTWTKFQIWYISKLKNSYISTIEFLSETSFAFRSQLKWNKVGFCSFYIWRTNITSVPVHIWHLNVKWHHHCVIYDSLKQDKHMLSLIIFKVISLFSELWKFYCLKIELLVFFFFTIYFWPARNFNCCFS